MPLSRNLYEIDEVVAALQLSLCESNTVTALFWTHELLVSEEPQMALETLHGAWLRWGAPIDHTILTTSEITPSLVLRIIAACQMATAEGLTPLSILNCAATTPDLPPVPTVPLTSRQQEARGLRATAFAKHVTAECETPEIIRDWWLTLDGAIRAGASAATKKTAANAAAWCLQWIQTQICADSVWIALTYMAGAQRGIVDTFRAAASPHPESQLLHQFASALFLSRFAQEIPPATAVDTAAAEAEWATWSSEVGQRRARRYAIPAAALHSNTTRGRIPVTYTNIDDCRNPLTLLPTACTFWQRVSALAGLTVDPTTGDATFPDDDVLERFMSTYFPDDTPDEWSAADQQKSHGRCCGGTATTPVDPTTVFIRDYAVGFSEAVAAVTSGLADARL